MIELLRILRQNTRAEDTIGKGNGGFGIILPETDETGSQVLAKRLLRLIQGHPPFQGRKDLKQLTDAISFQAFTYPDKFMIPEPLKPILEELPPHYTRP